MTNLHEKSIEDFGEQWTNLSSNTGYYGSIDVLKDICGPIFNTESFKNKVVIDIGAGTGRLTNLLIEAGASHVYSLEPSSAFEKLIDNTKKNRGQISYINVDGENIPTEITYDYALSIGVLHHIPNPQPTVNAAIKQLKKGGSLIIWLYGAEGNQTYLFASKIIRLVTTKLSHKSLLLLCKILLQPLKSYSALCQHLKLPMFKYMRNHISKLDDASLVITIYDQLNPCYSKYYYKDEAIKLLQDGGLINCKIYHRHNYSWTVIGQKA
jgi:SAM-dependent methyltransferase